MASASSSSGNNDKDSSNSQACVPEIGREGNTSSSPPSVTQSGVKAQAKAQHFHRHHFPPLINPANVVRPVRFSKFDDPRHFSAAVRSGGVNPSSFAKMQNHQSRFHVSSSNMPYPVVTSKPLSLQQVHRLQQKLFAALGEDGDEDRKVILGICAMAKKADSKPMNEIIRRLRDNFERLEVLVFDEDTILNKAVEDWPIVNGLVSFFSHGFPLEKAIAYKNLRNPFIVNDLEMQYTLMDRRKVYALLKENNIPHPRYAVLDRETDPDCQVTETEDSIEVNGNLFMKPFVEKPVDAENHNIYIYFPVQAGGGSTRLFRKVKDRSSIYSRFCRVRSKGSYLYEDFMPTDGTDVKVYTVGPDYQHAEARKSPALDGKVERDSDGKEIRYPVLLSNKEKLIARSICKVFGQNVCGFDLLRANDQIYVCDVNGFSFVKTSGKYYDDCAKILGTLVMRACCPQLQIPYPMCTAPEDIPVVQTTSGSMMELRCVIAVIRHGDRTPKQKMKMEVKNKRFFDLFEKYGGFKKGHLKLKKPKQLQEVLDIVRELLADSHGNTDPGVDEKRVKLNQLKMVLEMYEFSGINRKVQFKYQASDSFRSSSSEGDDDAPRDPSLVLILKWGGELTPAGRIQAENLGKAFRTLYPGGQGQFEAPGLGFLRLHSTFRHDLKIYASDEGRVQMTAAAFTKGLLSLEGELTPILVQMVKSANSNSLLDGESCISKYQMVVKEKLKEIFNQDRDFTDADFCKMDTMVGDKLAATNSISLVNAMQFVKNPFQMCVRVHEIIKEITARIRCLKMELKSRDLTLFNGESWELLIRRWAKLEKDFKMKNDRFDISKIPDIYDCIKYDLQHNQKTLQFKRAQELFMCSKALADIIVPQEYGIAKEERLHIAQNYCTPLLRKIRSDLVQCFESNTSEDSATRLDSKYSNGVMSPERFVRTRLYFTSESHIHSLLAMLRYGGFLDEDTDEQWKRSMDFIGACAELNYMSQIVLMMFEDPAKPEDSDERFHIELHFSPGAYTSCDEINAEPKGHGFRPKGNRGESLNEGTPAETPTDLGPEGGMMPPVFTMPDVPHMVPPPAPYVTPAAPKPLLRHCTSMPDADMCEEMEEFVDADLLIHEHDEPDQASGPEHKAAAKFKFKSHSPDPETPEWDWGEEEVEEAKGKAIPVASVTIQPPMDDDNDDPVFRLSPSKQQSLPLCCPCSNDTDNLSANRGESPARLSLSLPKSVEMHLQRRHTLGAIDSDAIDEDGIVRESSVIPPLPGTPSIRTQPIEINITSFPESNRGSCDEKRSRSLEDSMSEISPKSAAAQRHYRTIHLPLANDRVVQPISNFFFFHQTPKESSQRSAGLDIVQEDDDEENNENILSIPLDPELALEGFNNVPLLHPLETLHNNLTYQQMDDFLGRITTTKFPVPDMPALTSVSAKTLLTLQGNNIKAPDGFSSNNSSGGPSSPVGVVASDLMKTLGLYMGAPEGEVKAGMDSPAGPPRVVTFCESTESPNGLILAPVEEELPIQEPSADIS